ncbi:LexA family transcriptional regulator [Celeribacter ethanolicus]|uniref:LexA family transcriptional regulator n=1 Tax=Celeribacter ethanolicus TaxID=1758178 RepID=UPI000836E790|nr:S24 family peptidase [Celeribacter ethanolicus]
MENTFSSALANALEKTGTSLRKIAEQSGVSYEQLKKIKQGANKSTNVDDAMKVIEAFGVSAEEFMSGNIGRSYSVAVAGRVGAGATVQLEDPYPKGDGLYHIACPPQIGPHGIVAVEVEGNSMEPAYEAGDILFYSRDVIGVPSEAIGKRCVVEDADGMVWIKLLRRRDGQPEGLFDLISFHADTPPMYDVAVKWAAPVKMHLSAALAHRTTPKQTEN